MAMVEERALQEDGQRITPARENAGSSQEPSPMAGQLP